jgi:T-complex protein 1 subunit epsilon
MSATNAVYAQDEYGNPFIILREQEKKSRVTGLEAQKVRLAQVNLAYSC